MPCRYRRAGLALHLVVRNHALGTRLLVGEAAFTRFPFAELEAVAQHEAQHLAGRAAGIAGELFEAALLRRSKGERFH